MRFMYQKKLIWPNHVPKKTDLANSYTKKTDRFFALYKKKLMIWTVFFYPVPKKNWPGFLPYTKKNRLGFLPYTKKNLDGFLSI